MGTLSGAYETYTAIGIREDLSDVIYNISPLECPFMNSVGRGTATQTKHEWQTDELETADFNVVVEGNESAFTSPDPTERPNNYLQISEKTVAVSGTLEATDKAGRKSEMSYQMALKSKSLKRDCEFTVTQDQVAVTGPSGTARALASYEQWIDTNDSRASDGVDADILADGTPDPANPVTDGTQRALLEDYLKDSIQGCWTEGGDPTLIICGPFNKRVISTFAGNSTRFDKGEDRTLTAAFDVYGSDFGVHRIVPDRFSRDRSVLVVSPNLWSLDYLRPFASKPLAPTGDSEKRLLNVEFTLRASNRKGSGIVADLTTA